jgi:hypothetical protein
MMIDAVVGALVIPMGDVGAELVKLELIRSGGGTGVVSAMLANFVLFAGEEMHYMQGCIRLAPSALGYSIKGPVFGLCGYALEGS